MEVPLSTTHLPGMVFQDTHPNIQLAQHPWLPGSRLESGYVLNDYASNGYASDLHDIEVQLWTKPQVPGQQLLDNDWRPHREPTLTQTSVNSYHSTK